MNMLVRFGLEPDALHLHGQSERERLALHRRLLDALSPIGILVHQGATFGESDISQAISALPIQLRKRWQVLVTRLRRTPGPAHWPGLSSINRAADLGSLRSLLDLALLEQARAESLGLPAEELSFRPEDGAEIAPLVVADQATAVRSALHLAQAEIAAGTKVTALWDERFSRLAATSRTIVVVDSYAVQNLLCEGGHTRSGLHRLMVELDGCGGKPRKLTVYSSCKTTPNYAAQPSPDADACRDALERVSVGLRRGGLHQVELYLLPEKDFSKIKHDRCLRFDKTICAIGTGLEVLTGREVPRIATFSLREETDGSRGVERSLQAGALRPAPTVFKPGERRSAQQLQR
ncbi:MAG: hypothetical protein RBU45_15230 [Myxococcota bacterium]|jgi:hypothetical protein|nr:hypothetical protein [Myxococcota bacterium]